MPRKSRRVSFSLVKKKLRFNEENIRETIHPINKDHGYMLFSETKTPFPTHSDPVDAEDLRKRIQECIDRTNRMICDGNESNGDDVRYDMDDTQTPKNSLGSENEEIRRSEFVKKRKQLDKAEFIIAQQKSMSLEMPDRGPSVGNNWHIEDYNAGSSTYQIPTNFAALIDTSSVPHRHSSVNYETLFEIITQMSQSS